MREIITLVAQLEVRARGAERRLDILSRHVFGDEQRPLRRAERLRWLKAGAAPRSPASLGAAERSAEQPLGAAERAGERDAHRQPGVAVEGVQPPPGAEQDPVNEQRRLDRLPDAVAVESGARRRQRAKSREGFPQPAGQRGGRIVSREPPRHGLQGLGRVATVVVGEPDDADVVRQRGNRGVAIRADPAVTVEQRDREPVSGGIERQLTAGLVRERDGKPFNLLKFCSMRPADATESQTRWNIGDDERIGPIGRVLRKTSLDELPQLWNGLRGDTSIADRVRYDNSYIDNWSLWLDVKIVLSTFRAVVTGSGR